MALPLDSTPEKRLAALMDKYASEYGSLRITLKCLIETEQIEAAAHLADTLGSFWETQNYAAEGIHWLNQILQHEAIDQIPPLLKAELQVSAGHLTRLRNDYQQARTQFEQVLPFAMATNCKLSTSTLGGLGEVAFRQRNYDKAADYYYQYLHVSEQERNQADSANALVALGRIAGAKGNFQQARELYDQGSSICQQIGYQKGYAWALNAAGELERTNSNYDKAATLFALSADIHRRLGHQGASRVSQQNLAFTMLAHGQALSAEHIFARILPTWQRGPTKYGVALCLIGLARAAQIKHKFVASAKLLGLADALLAQIEVHLELTDQRVHDIVESSLRKRLGAEQYLAAHNSGSDSSLDEVLALAGLTSNIRQIPTSYSNRLTLREAEILELVAEGQTDKQIAERLVISPYTVNVHLRAIYRKLGANSRTAAVHLARVQALL